MIPLKISYEAKAAKLLVYEKSGFWATAVQRELGDSGVRVWETRTLDDCEDLLNESPASFLVIELRKEKIREILDRITFWQDAFPLFRFSVVADRELIDYRWLMQEAGAAIFICSPRKAADLVATACRHLAQVPPATQSFSERIWASLPWGRD
jgi:hypothetical protein